MNNDNINIPLSTYQGYLWKSGATKPFVLENDDFGMSIDGSSLTFQETDFKLSDGEIIIEGLLFDIQNMISYHLCYQQGEHLVYQRRVNAADFESKMTRLVEYKGFGKDLPYLQFLQYWTPQVDPMCENMEVLVPEAMVFVGFNHKEE